MKSKRHIFLKYLLLLLLSLKAVYFVSENINILDNDIELCSEIDQDENENDSKQELDENEKITHQHSTLFKLQIQNTNNNNHFIIKHYKTLLVEFTTPPPEKHTYNQVS
ncbi:hypothetical protein [Tenacibaculum geojense]|uniref:Secreted protein n=1 Tax=Tenacibaculum geojense TaxID=915352 RepID=A0ABW3JVY8_9FLAO